MDKNKLFYSSTFEKTQINLVPCCIDGESKVLLTTYTPDSQITPKEALNLSMKLKLAAYEAQSLKPKGSEK